MIGSTFGQSPFHLKLRTNRADFAVEMCTAVGFWLLKKNLEWFGAGFHLLFTISKGLAGEKYLLFVLYNTDH